MVFNMKLNPAPFESILSGKKVIELRLYDFKRRELRLDDYLIFTNTENVKRKILVKIKNLSRYDTFEQCFLEVSPALCGFEEDISFQEAAVKMETYYSPEDIKKFGVLAIGIELKNIEEVLTHKKAEEEAFYDKYFPDGLK